MLLAPAASGSAGGSERVRAVAVTRGARAARRAALKNVEKVLTAAPGSPADSCRAHRARPAARTRQPAATP